jgi:glycosyltransferase involved in cell wall biosynthesis
LSCCRQAKEAGFDVTLLMLLSPTGHISEHVDFIRGSLGVTAPGVDAPRKIVDWLIQNPQDILFLNGCEQADVAIPFLPNGMHCVYVVHDSAPRYWRVAVRYESQLDAIVAVSNTVARALRLKLRKPEKLCVLHNGTLFPADVEEEGRDPKVRTQDLLFLGGDEPIKGAYDVLKLWPKLVERGFEGQLHWFGRVSPTLVDQVQTLSRSTAIRLHGRVMRSEIFRQAKSARVLLMLSRAEPFGMATIECMGMGALPVAWDVEAGTREIVWEDYPYFAPLGDYDRLAVSVMKACTEYPVICGEAVDRARSLFSEGAMWQRYTVFIASISAVPSLRRLKVGQQPPLFKRPLRFFQLLPKNMRAAVRGSLGRSARWGYWLRNLRGI